MRLSPKALALQVPLRNLLKETTTLLGTGRCDLRDIRQVVRIIMADQPAMAVLAKLYRHLARTSPGIDLVIQPWQGEAAAVENLSNGTADLAVAVFRRDEPPIQRKELLSDHYVAAMRKGHPAARRFNLDRWLAYPHVLVSARSSARGEVDHLLSRMGRARRVGIVVPSFAMVPPLLENSDLIALVPSRSLPENFKEVLVVRDPPLAAESFQLHLAWHARRNTDQATQHVATAIHQLMV